MRFQDNPALCGPAAVANALEALGVTGVTQSMVADLIKTSGKGKPALTGTTQEELVRTLNRWASVTLSGCAKTAYEASYTLRGAIAWGAVAILGVDNTPTEGHWIAAVGMLGNRFLIADGASEEIVTSWTEQDLLARWTSYETKRGKQGTYYEIIVAEAKKKP